MKILVTGAAGFIASYVSHAYTHLYGFQTIGLRFFTVYGPWGRPDMAYWLFSDAMLQGQSIKVFNHGDMKRDFTYIDDAVQGVKAALFPEVRRHRIKITGNCNGAAVI